MAYLVLTKSNKGVGYMEALKWAAGGTGFTFLMTALGAATVFFLKKDVQENM